jgi:aminoglycoside 3-N-acetyltransferase
MKDFIRGITPTFLLNWNRRRKKNATNLALKSDQGRGVIFTKELLKDQLSLIGITAGDTLLIHSSMSKIGFLENGAKTLVEALLESIGEDGNLLMPNSPNAGLQLDYIRKLTVFDVQESPSQLGAISEYFRKLPTAKRSAHPTEPVSCVGKNADFFVNDHFGNLTPYNNNSPFYKVAQRRGKILYIGVTLANAGTSLHLLEDIIKDFEFSVYFPEEFEVTVKMENGEFKKMKTLVHDPNQSKKRKCDELIPLFKNKKALKEVKIGKAVTLLVDAHKMLEVMIDEYKKNGVTMYTPHGN